MTDTATDPWDESFAPPAPKPKPRTTTVKGGAGQKYKQPAQEPEPAPMSRRERMFGFFQTAALPLYAFDKADCATAVIYADPVSTATADLAANDPTFAKYLDKFLQTGPYGAFITAVAPMILQFFANHGIIPEGFAQKIGLKSREDLAAQADSFIRKLMVEELNVATVNGSEPN